MANLCKRRRKRGAKVKQEAPDDAISRQEFIDMLRVRRFDKSSIKQIVRGLPFDTDYLIEVQFIDGKIVSDWKPKWS